MNGQAREIVEMSQREILTSDMTLDKLIEYLPFPFIIQDGETVQFANPPAISLYKYGSLEEFVGTPIKSLLHPDDLEEFTRRMDRLLRYGEPLELFHQRRICRDGSVIHVVSRGVPIIWKGKRCLLGAQNDQTSRILAEQERELSERWFRMLVESASVSLLALDADWRCTAANPNAVKMLGFAGDDEMRGRFFSDLFRISGRRSPEDPTGEKLLRTMVDRFEVVEAADLTVMQKNGRKLPVAMRGNPIMIEGQPHGYMVVFCDLTAHLAEKKLGIARENAIRELRLALSRSSKRSDMYSLATVISHELTQPLSAVLNTVGALKRELGGLENGPGDRVLDQLQLIRDETERASKIISGLRELFEQGTSETSMVSLNEVVTQAYVVMTRDLFSEDVSYDLVLEDNLPPIKINPVQIQQVLYNLLRNAVEAVAGMAEKRITVRTQAVSADRIALIVDDTGAGMGDTDLKSLFQPFSSTRPGGTGMGLFTCASIVEAHNGTISATARDRAGTRFTVELPV